VDTFQILQETIKFISECLKNESPIGVGIICKVTPKAVVSITRNQMYRTFLLVTLCSMCHAKLLVLSF